MEDDLSRQADLFGRTTHPAFDRGDADEPPAVEWVFRYSTRARRIAVRVTVEGRVTVTVPSRVPRSQVTEFVHSQRAWITRTLTRLQASRPPPEAFPPTALHLEGIQRRVNLVVAGGGGRLRLRTLSEELLCVDGVGDTPRLQGLLVRWLMREAQRRLPDEVSELAARYGFEYGEVRIRRQRRRWGSCSRQRNLSLNVCLLFQRPEVVRYLIVHELAHTEHMNHGPRFWARVAACCPDWRRLDRELAHGFRRVPQWIFADRDERD